MIRFASVACSVGLGIALSVAAVSPGAAEWGTGVGQGFVEYVSRNESGSFIAIGCDVGYSMDHHATGISLQFDDGLLSEGAPIVFDVDGQTIAFSADASGSVATDCPGCAEKFRALWHLLRQGTELTVRGGESWQMNFSLRGIANVLPPEPCETK